MLQREQAIEIVKQVYAARLSGDKAALAQFLAEGATFEIVGDASRLPGVPIDGGAVPMVSISALVDRFTFSDLELVDAVVEGNTVAARWAVTITVAGREPARTQLFDLIRLTDSGKVAAFSQFADTALIRHQIG